MMRVLPVLAALAFLAGCTTYKLWTESGRMRTKHRPAFYEYRKFESPQVDERAGLDMARQRCADWGFKSAQRKGETASAPTGPRATATSGRYPRIPCLKDVAR